MASFLRFASTIPVKLLRGGRAFSTSRSSGHTVVIGMSGGVDSSVSAYLLKNQGYKAVGLFMNNWDARDESGYCTTNEDRRDASLVCKQLDIPFHEVNFTKDYWNLVFERTMSDFEKGLTPNPDVLCNRYIKFEAFSKYAIEQFGATYIATGHYCRTKKTERGTLLLCGADKEKDQSYFLSMVRPGSLDSVLFPVGEMLKMQVREIARQQGLISANRKTSVGFCFVGKRKFNSFLSEYLNDQQGSIIVLDNNNEIEIDYKHRGLHNYTIGQRVGIADYPKKEKIYVCHKDKEKNILYLAHYGHPAFYSDFLYARVDWILGNPPASKFRCLARTRYRQLLYPVTITLINNNTLARSFDSNSVENDIPNLILVEFDQPSQSLTQGQVVAFYQDEICLGGGIIEDIGPSYYRQQKSLPKNLSSASSLSLYLS